MDEVFDSSLDGFGTEEFLKIIRYVIKDANIFVISHKTGLEDRFESVIKFEKVKGFSRMVAWTTKEQCKSQTGSTIPRKNRNENLNRKHWGKQKQD